MVQLPLSWQFGTPKFTSWSPTAYINKCSIRGWFCKSDCYLDKHYSISQRECSLNLQCIGLYAVSSNNLHTSIHYQNTSQALYPQDHLWMQKTENKKTDCWPPAERKADSQYQHLGLKPWVYNTKTVGKILQSDIHHSPCSPGCPATGVVYGCDLSIQKWPKLRIQVNSEDKCTVLH